MKLKHYFSTKRCILLGFLFCLIGAAICFAGLSQADFKTERLQYPGKTPWYQTVHFGSDNYTMLGVTFRDGSIVGLGSWNNELFLSGGIGAAFNGSRIGNDSQLTMEFTILNGNDTQNLMLKKDDILDVNISVNRGSLNVNVQKIAELSESTEIQNGDKSIKFPPIYRKQNLTDDTCELTIPEDGIYSITVVGQGAAGSVSFVKRIRNS